MQNDLFYRRCDMRSNISSDFHIPQTRGLQHLFTPTTRRTVDSERSRSVEKLWKTSVQITSQWPWYATPTA